MCIQIAIEFNELDAPLEEPSSVTLKFRRLENQIKTNL